jgi:hypothetical protein
MYSNAQWVDWYGDHIAIRVDINGVTSFVPLDPQNTDYANLMELEREGKIVIQPADGTEQ